MHALFATLTYPYKIGDRKANEYLYHFITKWEIRIKNSLGFVCGSEKRIASDSDGPAGRHFHLVLFAFSSLDAVAIERSWKLDVGQGHGLDKYGNPVEGGHARVRCYDPSKGGLRYCLKRLLNQDEFNEILISDNIRFFVPGYIPKNAGERERIRRMRKRFHTE